MALWDKELEEMISYSVGCLQLGMQPTIKNSLFPWWGYHGKKNKFSFASSDHLEIASVLGMGACVCFSFQL